LFLRKGVLKMLVVNVVIASYILTFFVWPALVTHSCIMTKDRLADLKRIQNDDHDDVNNDTNAVGETVALTINENHTKFMEDFFEEVRVIHKLVDHISEKMEEVRVTHTAIVSAPIADERMKRQLDDLMADIKRTSGTVRQKLKDMEKKTVEFEKKNSNSQGADLRIRKSQHATLLRKFIETMNEYNLQQVKYRELCHDRIHRQLAITGQSMSNDELEETLEKGDFSVFTQGIIIEKQQAQQMLMDIEARHNDIIKMETSIRELHEMFADLAMIVETQGESIDRIEYNVTRTVEYVDSGNKQLDSASKNRKKARKKKIFIILCVIVALVIITLIITLSVILN
jgi:syntaxin 1A